VSSFFLVLLSVIFFILKKYIVFLDALCFGIGVAVFLQSYFLNPNFEVLNGTEIEWGKYIIHIIISTLVYICCIVLPLFFVSAKKLELSKHYKKIEIFTCILLGGIQLIYVFFLGGASKKTTNLNYVLTEKNEFELSSTKNTVVFIIDTLDGQWFENFILADSVFADKLKDFTYFDNAVAGGAPTVLGIPLMLTGEMYDTNDSLDTYYEQAYWKSTLLKNFADENIKIKLFTSTRYLQGSDYSLIDNASSVKKHYISEKIKFTKTLYKLVAFIEAPQLLKPRFWLYGNTLLKYVSVEQAADAEKEYVVDFNDPYFYANFKKKHVSVDYKHPCFVFYHLFGSHGPYNMNENAELVSSEQTSLMQQTKGAMKICLDVIEDMKNKGVYDSSTIIISGDHGGRDLYQNPAILCKLPHSNNEKLVTNSSQVTFQNLYNTYAKSLLKKHEKNYGDTLFEVKNIRSERFHVSPHVLGIVHFPNDKYVDSKSYVTYIIPDDARSFSDVKVLVQDFDEKKNTLSCIDVPNKIGKNMAECSVLGFYGFEDEYVWIRPNASVTLHNKKISKNGLQFSLNIPGQIQKQSPELRIYVNDILCKKMNTTPGKLEVYFSPEEVSSFDDTYEIRIEHDFSFVPKELGINDDTRELSFQVTYIGEKR